MSLSGGSEIKAMGAYACSKVPRAGDGLCRPGTGRFPPLAVFPSG